MWRGEQSRAQRSTLRLSSSSAAALHAHPAAFWNIQFLIQKKDNDKYEIIIVVTRWIRMIFISPSGVFLSCLFPSPISLWNGPRFLSWVVSTSAWELRCPKGRIWGVMRYLPWPQKFGECVWGRWSRGSERAEAARSESAERGEESAALKLLKEHTSTGFYTNHSRVWKYNSRLYLASIRLQNKTLWLR